MINFIAKPAFLNTASNTPFISKEESYHGRGHLQRVSSIIRSNQIVEYLMGKAQLNPETISPDDINIYVKPHIPKGVLNFNTQGKRSYIDIIDGWGLMPILETHPEIGVIACSKQDQEFLSKILNQEVKFIPQQHCNFKKELRTRKDVNTIGMIGTEDAFEWLPKGLEKELSDRNIKLIKFSKFFSREDIVNFYKSIDIQIVWRPYKMKLSNPLKLVNAASFGIPTIAYHETVFDKELGDLYIPVKNIKEFLVELDNLVIYPREYWSFADDLPKFAEDYHISKVAERYLQL